MAQARRPLPRATADREPRARARCTGSSTAGCPRSRRCRSARARALGARRRSARDVLIGCAGTTTGRSHSISRTERCFESLRLKQELEQLLRARQFARRQRAARAAGIERWRSSAPAMRSTATSPATWRCAWRRRPAASRASWPRRSSPRCRQPARGARRGRRRRLHQLLPGARGLRARAGGDPRAGRALRRRATSRRRRARAARVRLRQSRPDRCTSATAARPPTAPRWPTSCAAVGFSVAREYYINDAGRQMDILAVSTWVRYLRSLRRDAAVSGERLSRRLRARRWRSSCCAAAGETLRRPAAAVLAGLPADAPGGRQGGLHRCADRARARAHRRGRLSARCSSCRSTAMLADIREDLGRVRRRLRPLVLRARAGSRAARSTTRSRVLERAGAAVSQGRRAVVPRHASSATRRIAWWCARTARRPTSPPTSPITCEKRERGFARLIDVLGADHHGYVARVRGGPDRHGRARRVPRGRPDPVREPVPRRRERSRWASARRSS